MTALVRRGFTAFGTGGLAGANAGALTALVRRGIIVRDAMREGEARDVGKAKHTAAGRDADTRGCAWCGGSITKN